MQEDRQKGTGIANGVKLKCLNHAERAVEKGTDVIQPPLPSCPFWPPRLR